MSGKAKVGDTIQIMPGQIKAKIRGIQIHNEMEEVAVAGQRTAMNLQGIDKDTIQRGNILTPPDTFEPTVRMDISLKYLPGTRKKLKNRTPVRFHTGTSEIISRIILLDKNEIEPGEEVYAQVILESPTVATAGDRFVIRSYSPVSTIGGGEILDPIAEKYKRHFEQRLTELKGLKSADSQEKTRIIIERAGLRGISTRQLSVRTGIPSNKQNKIMEGMFSRKGGLLLDRDDFRIVSFSIYKTLQNKILQEIKTYHERFPLREGHPKEELRTRAGRFIDSKLFNKAIRDLEHEGHIVVEQENIRRADHSVNLKGKLGDLRENIAGIYLESKLTPPSTKEMMERFSDRKTETVNVLNVMFNEGILIKINEDIYYHKQFIDTLRKDYKEFLLKNRESTPATFREMTGLSRKYIIPLMEYFDKTKLTIRVGDHRVLREKKENGT